MIDIFKQFIINNPDKVLGTIKETTDRFGNPDIIIQGGLENLELIDVSSVNVPNKNVDTSNIDYLPVSNSIQQDNIEKSLSITKTVNLKKASQVNAPVKKRTVFNLFIEGDKTQKLYSDEEAFNILNKGITETAVSVWAWYNNVKKLDQSDFFTSRIPTVSDSWFELQLKNNYICFDPVSADYVPSSIYYSGNIYDKIIELETHKYEFLKRNIEHQITQQYKSLKNILPTPLKLTGNVSDRLILSVLSKFVADFEIEHEGNTMSLLNAFKEYLRNLESSDFKTNVRSHQIINYYIEGDRFPNHYDKFEKVTIKRNCANECVVHLQKFLESEISEVEQQRIEYSWNRQHNGFVDIDFNKIPLMFNVSKLFKDGSLQIRDAQREGVAYCVANGTGIIAYDVGVGKTLTAILNVANMLQSGQAKRPLIVVPKSTYAKWVGEINGIFDEDGNLIGSGIIPQYTILDLFNINDKRRSLLFKDGKFVGVPEGVITICTYEGFQKMGFSDEASADFMSDLKEILNQGYSDETERKKALDDEKLNRIIGVGQEGTIINIDEAQFDHLTIDEAHNFNKIFSSVKGDVNEKTTGRSKNNYKITGSQSSRGIKAFFVSNYIQKISKTGNICLLTATPFTNNPLEVYNMLALTNIKRLATLGLKSIVSFFDNYVNQTFEKVIKSTGEIEESAVIKGWSNKVSLQKILFTYMNYKSGEDANIKRPQLWTLPKLSEMVNGVSIPLPLSEQSTTYLHPTREQKEIQKEISQWLIAQLKDSELMKRAPHLVADIKAKKNCISPYIYNDVSPNLISPVDFIESSPKLKYTMECIKSVKKWHEDNNSPVSCQVIYINGGVEYLYLIKRYLIEEIGYGTGVQEYKKGKFYDEVEILAGSGDFKREDEEKEEIKTLFNSGKVKIIIGTSTIREGIDLQGQSTVLYALWVDWNPTDSKQLTGRIWRFGNKFSNVRVVTPLLVGSSDAFTYQKLEEKTGRINDIFDRVDKTNILDVSEEDREAVKWALIDDLEVIARSEIKDEVLKLEKEISLSKESINKLDSVSSDISKISSIYDEIQTFTDKYLHLVPQQKFPIDFERGNAIEEFNLIYNSNKEVEAKLSYSDSYNFKNKVYHIYYRAKERKKTLKSLDILEVSIMEKFGVSVHSDLDVITDSLKSEISDNAEKIQTLKSSEYFEELLDKLESEKLKFNSGIETFEETVEKFTRLNYLLGSMEEKQQVTVVELDKIVTETIESKGTTESSLLDLIESFKLLAEMSDSIKSVELLELIEGLELLV